MILVIAAVINGKAFRFKIKGPYESETVRRIITGHGYRVESWEPIYSGFDEQKALSIQHEEAI